MKNLNTSSLSLSLDFQVLDAARKRLFAVHQERARVVDLLCHADSSIVNAAANAEISDKKRALSALDGRVSVVDSSRLGVAMTDALGPYTPETDQVQKK